MTLTKGKTLYEQDFALWIEETVKQLKSKNFSEIDLDNLIEEVESLGRADKRELENRLITLFEHALKRCYIKFPDCYRGWEVTLNRTQQKLNQILDDSPSLRNFLEQISFKCYQKALYNTKIEYDNDFPEEYPFAQDIDKLLNYKFWQD
jgi:hypothetical protein